MPTINNPISDNCLLYSSYSEVDKMIRIGDPNFRSLETSNSCPSIDVANEDLYKLLEQESQLAHEIKLIKKELQKKIDKLSSLHCERRSIFDSDCSGDDVLVVRSYVIAYDDFGDETFYETIYDFCLGYCIILSNICKGEILFGEPHCQGMIDFHNPEMKFFDRLCFHGDIFLNIKENSRAGRVEDLRLPIFSSNEDLFLCMQQWDYDGGGGLTLREALKDSENDSYWPLTFSKVTKDKSFASIIKEEEPTHILFVSDYENTDLSNFERPFFDESGAARYYLVPIHLVTPEFLEEFEYRTCSNVFVCWAKEISDIEESHPLAKKNYDLSFESSKISYHYGSSNA